MTWTKAGIAQKIADDGGFMRGEAAEIIEKLPEILKVRLVSGEDVMAAGFGKCSVTDKRVTLDGAGRLNHAPLACVAHARSVEFPIVPSLPSPYNRTDEKDLKLEIAWTRMESEGGIQMWSSSLLHTDRRGRNGIPEAKSQSERVCGRSPRRNG
jgi:hypothetical protein